MAGRRPPEAQPSVDSHPSPGVPADRKPLDWRIPDLGWSILATLAYADVFDFPMRMAEIHHYLIGRAADPDQIDRVLDTDRRLKPRIERRDGVAFLAGRDGLQEKRREREEIARRLWPAARRYAAIIASLPFVRMVALTGALALENTDASGDIDYLVVTAPGRLWLTRAMVVLWVRRAALEGVSLCPNYLLSEDALHLPDQDLFAAHELVQMVPLAGLAHYWRMRQLNHGWVSSHLPNAGGLPPGGRSGLPGHDGRRRLMGPLGEKLLKLRLVDPLERWEMSRKIRRFAREIEVSRGVGPSGGRTEERFGHDWCKGHFDHHAMHTLAAYSRRLENLADGWP